MPDLLKYIIIAVIIILVITIIAIFNRFVKNKNFVKDAWSNIDVALKKRYELVPNLVSTVKGYAKHESELLEKVVHARNNAMQYNSDNLSDKMAAENALSKNLKGIFILSEAYPDLKANRSFLDLQNQLVEIEETLERSRRYYNGTVRQNNIYGESFPAILFTKLLNYKHYEFFTIDDAVRNVVKVDLSKKPVKK